MAKQIAEKSPLAIYGTKHLLNHARDHGVHEGLQYTAVWNGNMLQSQVRCGVAWRGVVWCGVVWHIVG